MKTVAGSGAAGVADGPAAQATFLMPVSIAFGKDGRLYVVDKAAQRIREVYRGSVHTIAGSGVIDRSGLHVPGGYRDGPEAQALFNEPTSIAVARDGSLYVSDSGNHCIRKIADGFVTTVLGSIDRPVHQDGNHDAAAFTFPDAVAFDEDGTLYVADFGVGIDRVLADGSIEQLPKDPNRRGRIVGLSAFGHGSEATVYATDLDGAFYIIHPNKPDITGHGDADIEGGGERLLFGIAAINDGQFLATNLKTSSISICRLPVPPFVGGHWSCPTIVGDDSVEPSESAGHDDGGFNKAKFYSPLGIAASASRLAIADTGNRRIRLMPMPDTRRSASPSSLGVPAQRERIYRILYIGASYSFWGTTYPKSIAGLLESQLNSSRVSLGLTKPVEVSTLRIDDAFVSQEVDAVKNYVADGAFDLIVFGSEWGRLTLGPPSDGIKDSAAGASAIADLQRSLQPQTKILVFAYPSVGSTSLIDLYALRDSQRGSITLSEQMDQASSWLASFGKNVGPALFDTSAFRVFHKLQIAPTPSEWWPADEVHPTLAGRTMVADALYQSLSELKPWLK